MNSIKLSIETIFSTLFGSVISAFSGNYKNKEVNGWIKELHNTEIPTIKHDRMNLKKDADNVVLDYKKAFLSKG